MRRQRVKGLADGFMDRKQSLVVGEDLRREAVSCEAEDGAMRHMKELMLALRLRRLEAGGAVGVMNTKYLARDVGGS